MPIDIEYLKTQLRDSSPEELEELRKALGLEQGVGDPQGYSEMDKRALEKALKEANAEAKNFRLRLKEYEDKHRSEQERFMDEQEKYKDMYEKSDSKLKELEMYQEKYYQLLAARRKELLDRMPKDKRDAYKDFAIEQLEIVAKDLANLKPQDSVGVNKSQSAGNNFDFDKLTEREHADLLTNNPTLYEKLQREYLAKTLKY